MRYDMKKLLCGSLALVCAGLFAAEKTDEIPLPTPNLKTNVSLKFALDKRRTSRTFAPHALSELDISNLLWAAYGSNRADGKRTVPAAMGIYSISIYAALPDGVYQHLHGDNILKKISSEDVRSFSDSRKMGAKAPVVLIMVADKEAFGEKGGKYEAIEAGAIMQNIYLYCAGNGLNTVVCGSFDGEKLSKALKLPASKYVILTQVVGCGR